MRLALVWLVLLGGGAFLGPAAPARAALNGAGLLVRHGDGRLVVAYVEFAEPRISGVELLRRAGLTAVLASQGYGEAVCAINGEGCRADNCFCRSYGNPSFYWRYYQPRDGRWVYAALGPSNRQLGDGDIDGWEWSSGGPQLPLLTIDQIAARAGVQRSAPAPAAPTATLVPPTPVPPSPTLPPAPTATARPQPTPSPTAIPTRPPVAATAPVSVSPAPTLPPATAPTSPTMPPSATPITALPTPPPSPAPPAGVSQTSAPSPAPPTSTVALTATRAPTVVAAVVATSVATTPATPAAVAVVIAPSGETTPVPAADPAGVPWAGYLVALLAGLALVAYLAWAARRRARHGDADAADLP